MRWGCIEFRADQGAWRLLTEADIRLHFVLHTDVAKWLQTECDNAYRTGAAKGNN